MAKCIFKPASRQQIMSRGEDALREWVLQFEKRPGVTKNPDGSFDVRARLDLSKERVFDYAGLDATLIKKHIRFRRVIGRFSVRLTELFVLLPEKLSGDLHVIGNLGESIGRMGCDHEGRIVTTLYGW